jgi:hypothetical protein
VKNAARARTSSLVLTVCLLTACGGSTSSTTSGTATPGTATTGGGTTGGATTGATTTSSPVATVGGGGGTTGIPVVADGSFKTGTAHIEISGGRSDTFDLRSAGGFAASGSASIVFTDSQRTFNLTFTGGGEAAGAIVIATSAYTIGAELGKECQIKVTRNDANGLSGELTCKDATGIALPATPLAVNIKGTFSADR